MKAKKLSVILIIALLLAAISPAALAAPGGSAMEGLVLLYGADEEGNNVSGNYWNGFVVADPDGQQYVIAGSGSYLDFVGQGDTVITPTAFTDEGSCAVTATVYDISAGVALYKVDGSIPGATALYMADSTRIDIGGEVKVVGFDWTRLSGSNTRAMHSSFDTTVSASFEGEKYTFYTLADAAASADWESAAVVNEDGHVVGIFVADSDLTTFFPVDVIISALGYKEGTHVTAPNEDGPGVGLIVTLVLIAALAVILGYSYLSYRRKVAAGHLPDNRKNRRGEDDSDIPMAGNYHPGERLCIIGISGYYAGQKFRINGEVTIGRSAARCNLVFPDSTRGMSSVHCMIRQRGGQLEVKDLGSTSGTFCRGLQVAPNTSVMLSPGERFYLGGPQTTFEVSL